MTTTTERNKQIARRYLLDVWGEYDFEAEKELVAEDVVDHNAIPDLPPGREGHNKFLRICQAALPEIEVTIEELLAEGDRVAYGWTARGTSEGPFLGIAPTGKEVTITGTDIVRIENGKIAEMWHVEENLGLMRQLGAAPPPA
ncbi:MAG: ester cyclase [Candidatus Promineifilaceae bacterium]|nr:ester cyclase [Candidatus Promineifilaceae bacterium]